MAGVLPNSVMAAVVKHMAASAADSAMRIRTAPPFVGRDDAPGSARCGRAPAIAYAPRSESGKASSDLAYRRRVCGRLCWARGMSSVVFGCPRFVVFWPVPGIQACRDPDWSVGGPIEATFQKQLEISLRLLLECSINFCGGDPTSPDQLARANRSFGSLNWTYVQPSCDVFH